MEVTVNLTDSMINKLEVYRAMHVESIERLLINQRDDESKEFLEEQIEKYKYMPMDSLTERYLA